MMRHVVMGALALRVRASDKMFKDFPPGSAKK